MNGEKYTTNQKKAKVNILISDRVDFNARRVIRDKKHIIIEGSLVQEDITMLNVYKSHSRVSNCVRQNLRELHREID